MESNEKKKYSLNDLSNCDIVVCTKDYVSKKQGSVTGQVQVDHTNSRYVRYSKGRVEITH